MRTIVLTMIILFSCSTAFAGGKHGHSVIPEMADILHSLNHHPSAKEKAFLNGVANDSSQSAATRSIAKALKDMDHSVQSSDKAALMEIMNDGSATEHEKNMAKILMGLNHKASSGDKAMLKGMMH